MTFCKINQTLKNCCQEPALMRNLRWSFHFHSATKLPVNKQHPFSVPNNSSPWTTSSPGRYLSLLIYLVLARAFCSLGSRLWPQLSYEFQSDGLRACGQHSRARKRSGLIRHSGSGIHPPLLEARAHRERKAKDDRERKRKQWPQYIWLANELKYQT